MFLHGLRVGWEFEGFPSVAPLEAIFLFENLFVIVWWCMEVSDSVGIERQAIRDTVDVHSQGALAEKAVTA